MGRVHTTETGTECQAWSSSIPPSFRARIHKKFPDKSVRAAKNYCRNPDDSDRPWCYTDSTYEFCDIPMCRGLSFCLTSQASGIAALF